jgi:glycogen synthase
MLMGTLPVASRVGGIPEIIEGTYAERMMFSAWMP